jgi:carboxypeptidase C (cathepsin A)
MPDLLTDQLSITQHTVSIDDQSIGYTAIAGTLILKEEAEKREGGRHESEGEKPKASVFFVAYVRNDVPESEQLKRPITFSFNGGPGSSSVWMHLGLLGPRRVNMGDVGGLTPPPWGWAENSCSLLDETDLVFIDPVGTGYSRAVVGEAQQEYFHFQKDIESMGNFIRLFCTRYKRWASPKYVIGESYGTTRAAALSGYLQDRHGMFLNGIIFVSTILNFQTTHLAPGNDLPYALYLPSFAAVAWYHHRLVARQEHSLTEIVQAARDFALGEYSTALMRGTLLSKAEEARIAAKVSRLIGIPTELVLRCNLRVDLDTFVNELLRDEGKVVGRLDARFTGFDLGPTGKKINLEPSSLAYNGPYTAALYDYLHRELKYESDLPYEVMNMRINSDWRFDEFEGTYVDVSETLRRIMCSNPHLKVLVCNGYYDLATPFGAAEYTFNHLYLPTELRSNVRMAYYEAGHLMYVHAPSLLQQKRDLAAFLQS